MGADFPLQKVFLDNTPIKKGPSMFCLHRKFIQTRTMMGIKNNHPYGVLMSFRDLQHETILEVMEQNNDKVSQEMKKGILNQLHQYDADKVLNFVIESFIESLSAKSDAYVKHWMAQFILLIATRFIDKKLVFNEKIAVVPANTTKRTLDLLSKYRDIVIESLLGTSLYMFTDGLTYMKAIAKLNEMFPEHAFDLSSPVDSSIKSEKFIAGHRIPLLEYIILCNNMQVYLYLTETALVQEDPDAPYIALTYYTKNKDFREFFKRKNIGTKNQVLPPYICGRPISILASIVTQKSLVEDDYFELESLLIAKKFRLLPEEEKEFSSLPEARVEYKLAKCLRNENYSPFDNLVEDFETEIGHREQFEFQYSNDYRYLKLTRHHRRFEYNNSGRYFGSWEVIGSSIICTSEKKRWLMSWGSYTSTTYEEEGPHHEVFRFTIFRMFDGVLAVHLEDDTSSAAQKLSSSMRMG
jgi:hypothetical protein